MNGLKYRIIGLGIIFTLIISCSQKYDSTGIFEPDEPDFYADSVLYSLERQTAVPRKSVNDGYLYLGRDISEHGDTTAFAESVFRFRLPDTQNLDSAYIFYRLNISDTLDYQNKTVEIFRYNGVWDTDLFVSGETASEHYLTAPLVIDTVSVSGIRINLAISDIEQWSLDTADSAYSTLFLKNSDINELSPLIRMYSSKWTYDSQKPFIRSFYSYPDTVLTESGNDSIFTVTEERSEYIKDDITVGYKKTELSGDPASITIGGLSGESYICSFDLSTFPSDAVVLTGRISLPKALAGSDPVYGGIETAMPADKEIYVYIMTDSLWILENGEINYDSLNVWTYKISLSGNDNYFSMDTVIQNWIKEPDTNFGIMITSEKWGSPFGRSAFLKPELNVSYITVGGGGK